MTVTFIPSYNSIVAGHHYSCVGGPTLPLSHPSHPSLPHLHLRSCVVGPTHLPYPLSHHLCPFLHLLTTLTGREEKQLLATNMTFLMTHLPVLCHLDHLALLPYVGPVGAQSAA